MYNIVYFVHLWLCLPLLCVYVKRNLFHFLKQISEREEKKNNDSNYLLKCNKILFRAKRREKKT